MGGSFDPAHNGHVHITLEALKRFGLDQVWWLISPGNPLKENGPAPLHERMARAQKVMSHPRVRLTDLEQHIGTRYTADTLEQIKSIYPRTSFVWLMGADNLHQFHLWERWKDIMYMMPMGILARPGDRIDARTSITARIFGYARVPASQSQMLSNCQAPAWCFVNVAMCDHSSSAIRATGDW